MEADGLPEVQRIVIAPVQIDPPHVPLRAPADQASLGAGACQVDRERQRPRPVEDAARVDDLPLLQQQPPFAAADGPWLRAARAAKAQLVEARSRSHHDAEAAGSHLQVKLALITFVHLVEQGRLIGDQSRQNVQTAGGALRIGERGNFALQPDGLEQWDDVQAPALQHRTPRQIHPEALEVGVQLAHFLQDFFPLAGEKARIYRVGHLAQAQVDAGRLDLVVQNVRENGHGCDIPTRHHLPDLLTRQDAGVYRRAAGRFH